MTTAMATPEIVATVAAALARSGTEKKLNGANPSTPKTAVAKTTPCWIMSPGVAG